jgi:hypothetical protein
MKPINCGQIPVNISVHGIKLLFEDLRPSHLKGELQYSSTSFCIITWMAQIAFIMYSSDALTNLNLKFFYLVLLIIIVIHGNRDGIDIKIDFFRGRDYKEINTIYQRRLFLA